MKTRTLCSVAVFLLLSLDCGRASEIDSLLCILDRTIDQRQVYVDRKEKAIEDLKRQHKTPSVTPEKKYEINKKLLQQYRPYIYDSAVHYAILNMELAEQLGDRIRIAESKINFAFILLTGGMQKEALETLDSIDVADVAGTLAESYYLCYEQCYLHLSVYVAGTMYEQTYRDKSRMYVRLLAKALSPYSENYFALSRVYFSNDNLKVAQTLLEELLDRIEPGTHGYAIVTSTLAETYRGSNDDIELREKYLILAAISDFNSAVKEYVALSNLAEMLYYSGDIERAYRYGTISMADANFYNARLRRAELSKTFPILEQAYKSELNHKNSKLQMFILFISLLAVIVIGAFIYIYRQTLELRKVRRKLLVANDSLSDTNRLLSDANKVKEVYLGRILALCSSYINRLEKYQSMVRNKLSMGKVDEVRTMSNSPDLINYEINEFYNSFDKTLLKLYPDFVEEFNRLLRPEERAAAREEGATLTPEMRIYALIRLGISDSSSIAKILRYSPNTVYTYRHKAKQKAVSKDTFEDDIMKIGF